jgi:alpha-D-xyloside xylohydrolase
MTYSSCTLLLAIALVLIMPSHGYAQIGNFNEQKASGRGVVFLAEDGSTVKVTSYGREIVRVQALRKGEEFLPDDYYEMVQKRDWTGHLSAEDKKDTVILSLDRSLYFTIALTKNPMKLEFRYQGKPFLTEQAGIRWNDGKISESFVPDASEHFTGLGHGYFGRASGIDLKGQVIERNYGTKHGDQSPLIVPFYLSSKGYGIFVNSTCENRFSFNHDGKYGFSIDNTGGSARMDYFVIVGPSFAQILESYTQLTGRPRFPPMAIFGLGLSDKANDETTADPSDEKWWKRKVTELRAAGIPIDHLINDNRWRAGGGKRCESFFDWDKGRFPDPAEYAAWLKANGLITTIDYNRCISERSEGWSASYSIPFAGKVDYSASVPDFTRKDVREWFWGLFWNKSLDPKLQYPGDALWIDEFDELGPIADTVTLGNGLRWGEMKNYYPFLIAKALVQEGWDKTISPAKRPFVWVRGMTAGAQRYATLWTGDIKPTNEDMKNQIVAMQLAGLSGFPFEGHDAGGFYDWDTKKGPDENLYQRWAMALGCFTPFWKPHGWGQSRWPLDRSPQSIEAAKKFVNLRYALLPYIYSIAHQSSATGMPMARAMVIDYQNDPRAWKYDLQYMWGDAFLVVPNPTESDTVTAWLPKGKWIDFWTNEVYTGDTTMNFHSPVGGLVLLVKDGSIIPMAHPAMSTAFIKKDSSILNIYTGTDGNFALYEDDGITEYYKTGENCVTPLAYNDNSKELSIGKGSGTYSGAPKTKSYQFNFIGIDSVKDVLLERRKLRKLKTPNSGEGYYVDAERNMIVVIVNDLPVSEGAHILIVE